jgi:hypothetical protein
VTGDFDLEDGGDVFLLNAERRLIFNELHGVISQKIEPFITTAVRASHPTYFPLVWKLFPSSGLDATSKQRMGQSPKH